MELRFHGSGRHPEPFGYLVDLQVTPEPQQDDGPLVDIEYTD